LRIDVKSSMHQSELQTLLTQCPAPGINIGIYSDNKWRTYSQGYIDDRKILTNSDIYYDIASLTKTFIATQILLFVQSGSLTLDTPASMILPCLTGFCNIDNNPITIHNLLTHTSGILLRGQTGEVYDKTREYSPSELRTIYFEKHNLSQESLSRTNYRCINYIFLGEIIRIMTGEPLDTTIHTTLTQLGVTEITFTPLQKWIPLGSIAKSEAQWSNGLPAQVGIVQDEKARGFGGVAGNAGMFGTLNGLLRWTECWLKNSFGFDQDLYKSSFYFDTENVDLVDTFGNVWRNGRWSIYPNMSGYNGPIIIFNPEKHVALVATFNSTFPDLETKRKSIQWIQKLTKWFESNYLG
jgi:CubicO group peptidase (beta-lactamase class C family)